MLGDLISAGARIWGGIEDRKAAEKAQQLQLLQAERNEALQREFAQNGIRWKVEDANRAGIHPLFALGANTIAGNPVALGDVARPSMADTMGEAGQDISRAINATRTSKERTSAVEKTATSLQLKNFELKNELLAAQVAKLKASTNPPMPTGNDKSIIDGQSTDIRFKQDDPSERKPIGIEGRKWGQTPGWGPAEDVESEYGDIAQEVYGMGRLARDAWFNLTESQKVQAALSWAHKNVGKPRTSMRERRGYAYGSTWGRR